MLDSGFGLRIQDSGWDSGFRIRDAAIQDEGSGIKDFAG